VSAQNCHKAYNQLQLNAALLQKLTTTPVGKVNSANSFTVNFQALNKKMPNNMTISVAYIQKIGNQLYLSRKFSGANKAGINVIPLKIRAAKLYVDLSTALTAADCMTIHGENGCSTCDVCASQTGMLYCCCVGNDFGNCEESDICELGDDYDQLSSLFK
jgi:hypothetical protein